jgi:hypothetical protein
MSRSNRRALLTAALGFLQLRQDPAEVATLRRYLDSWRGLGDVVVGLNAQGYDLELRQVPARLARLDVTTRSTKEEPHQMPTSTRHLFRRPERCPIPCHRTGHGSCAVQEKQWVHAIETLGGLRSRAPWLLSSSSGSAWPYIKLNSHSSHSAGASIFPRAFSSRIV